MVLARFLAKAGVASRRKADDIIAEGRVQVNGQTVTAPPTRVDPAVDEVRLDGKLLRIETKRYLLLNKPRGYICTADDPYAEKKALDLVADAVAERLFHVGRLDKDSEGLLLFTNDGELANRLMHPRYEVRKTYQVSVDGAPVLQKRLDALVAGIEDEGDLLQAVSAEIERRGSYTSVLRIVIAEGKNREIRRMCRAMGWQVRRLVRLQLGPLKLGPLPVAEYRDLTPAELTALLKQVGLTP